MVQPSLVSPCALDLAMLSSSMHCRADAEVAAGDAGYEAILRDPEVAGVVLVLPPHVGPHVCSRPDVTNPIFRG